MYRVVQKHQVVRCELKAANGELIETHGIVDVEAPFRAVENGRASNKKFVLSRCIVASIPFSVISPFVLAKHGWGSWLDLTDKTCLMKGSLSIPLGVRERAWWALACLKGASGPQKPPKSSKNSDVQPMDLSSSESKVQIGDQVTVVVGDPGKPLGVSRNISQISHSDESVSPGRGNLKSAGTLSFMLRCAVVNQGDVICFRAFLHALWCHVVSALSSLAILLNCATCQDEPNPQMHVMVMSSDSEVVETAQSCSQADAFDVECDDGCVAVDGCLDEVRVGEDDDMPDIPLPGLDEDLEGQEDGEGDDLPLEECELELGPEGWYDHISRGHQPYLSSCLACARAQGKIPARRLRLGSRSRSVVNSDFGFRGGIRFLIMMVAATGMNDGQSHECFRF